MAMTDTKPRVMLAHDREKYPYLPTRHWLVSEKLEGMRAFWDGGITRGQLKSSVSWANTDKDGRYLKEPVSTGLWSRLGHVVCAPDWFLDALPKFPLDGELYCGLGIPARQHLFSAVKKLNPVTSEWEAIQYYVFDTFNLCEINSAIVRVNHHIPPCQTFINRLKWLQNEFEPSAVLRLLPQTTYYSEEVLNHFLAQVTDKGGEGLIIRDPAALYAAGKRVKSILKIKKLKDSEGRMIGWSSGRETDKGSKLLGKMGNLVLAWVNPDDNKVIFELSGFTDIERLLKHDGEEWAKANPGQRAPDNLLDQCLGFEPGCLVQFIYRDVTRDGMPVEARFKRIREED